MLAATQPIRIIDLLSHTSGIAYAFIPGDQQKSYTDAGIIEGMTTRNLKLEEQMKLLAKQPLAFEPGTKWQYGLNTDVLGYLIQEVSGQRLDEFFQQQILGPLGMVPLPSKWIMEFGEPIRTDSYDPTEAEDPMLVFNVTDQVRETIQHTLFDLLRDRGGVFG